MYRHIGEKTFCHLIAGFSTNIVYDQLAKLVFSTYSYNLVENTNIHIFQDKDVEEIGSLTFEELRSELESGKLTPTKLLKVYQTKVSKGVKSISRFSYDFFPVQEI